MKYVLIIAAVLAAVLLIVVVIGFSLPVKHTASAQTTVKASPETVFALITNVEGFPAWRKDVKSAERFTGADGKPRFREVSAQGTTTYLVESTEPNRRLVTRIDDKNLPYDGAWTYEVEPAADGRTTLRIVEDGEVYNPVFRFVSRFLMGHDSTIKSYLSAVERRFPG